MRGKRAWPYEQLADAVRASSSWPEVVGRLGYSPGNGETIARVRGYAAQFDLDTRHFVGSRHQVGEMPFTAEPSMRHLRYAAGLITAAWFMRRGYAVSFPAEPRPYDLIVEQPVACIESR